MTLAGEQSSSDTKGAEEGAYLAGGALPVAA